MRVRIRYEKGDEQRFLGHLEVRRALVMALLRAGWPVAMTAGYTPRPKMEMVAPLPVGTAGLNEVADVYLRVDRSLEELGRSLANAMPPGFKLKEVWQVSPGEPALERRVRSSTYRVLVYGSERVSLKEAVEQFLMQREARFRRETREHGPGANASSNRWEKDREIDLRPFVRRVEIAEGDPPGLRMVLNHFEGRTVRPTWVLGFLVQHYGLSGVDPRESIVDREWLDWGDGSSHASGDFGE